MAALSELEDTLAFYIVLGVHLFLCLVLIGLVLLQQGKGADAGAVLGGGSNTVFGAAGATSLMVKVTTGVAVCVMVTSIFLIRGYPDLMEAAATGIQVKDPGLPETPLDEGTAAGTESVPAGAAASAAAPAEAKKDDTGSSQNTSPATSAPDTGAPGAATSEPKAKE